MPFIQVGTSSQERTLESVTGTFFRGTTRNQGFSCDVAPSFAKVRRVFWAVPTESEGFPGGSAFHFPHRNSGDSESPEFRGPQAARAGPWNQLGGGRCPSSQQGGPAGPLFPAEESKTRISGLSCTEFCKRAPSCSGGKKCGGGLSLVE